MPTASSNNELTSVIMLRFGSWRHTPIYVHEGKSDLIWEPTAKLQTKHTWKCTFSLDLVLCTGLCSQEFNLDTCSILQHLIRFDLYTLQHKQYFYTLLIMWVSAKLRIRYICTHCNTSISIALKNHQMGRRHRKKCSVGSLHACSHEVSAARDKDSRGDMVWGRWLVSLSSCDLEKSP